ncbi:MAG: hypothetical protein AAGD38_17250 [Acidobacteriota bacterium]
MTMRRELALLLLIVVCGLGLRLWYGSAFPDSSRFWDEQYSLQNVRSLLATQTLEPASGYYPSPVFNLPPTLILRQSVANRKRWRDGWPFERWIGASEWRPHVFWRHKHEWWWV